MKKNTLSTEAQASLEKVLVVLRRLRRYSLPIFIIFVGIIYGIVILRIQTLSTAQPTPDAVSSQVKAARIPHIDQSIVRQLQTLQDNSVNVKALFNQARSNPFQ